MPQFEVSTFSSQIFWLVLVFGFLYLLVSRVIAPKAENILTSRNRIIDDFVDSADEYTKKTEVFEKLKEQQLYEANQLAEELRQIALAKLNEEFAQKQEAIKVEMKEKTAQMVGELHDMTQHFNVQKAKPSVELAAAIIKKITGKEADFTILERLQKGAK